MKKNILSVIVGTILTVTAFAQIPNNGFENWTSMGSYSNPDNWDQLNAMTSSMSVYTCTKGTPGQTGTAYLKLTSKNVSGMGIMPGLATTGMINMGNMSVTGGFAFTQRPQSLTGAWQYMIGTNDTGFVAVYLTKWNNSMNMRDTVAMAWQSLYGMGAMTWANFSINLMYMNGNNPDTAQIILSSSGMTPVANSYLYVDNLAFAGSVAGVKENSVINNLSVYPNPAREKVSIDLFLQKSTSLKIQLIDASGKSLQESNESNLIGKINRSIVLSNLAKGIYFLKVSTDSGNEVRKIIVE